MELFRNPNIDFLGKKWIFLGLSLVLSVAGIVSMATRLARTGDLLPFGIDFKGGTLVYVKFADRPNEDSIRTAMDKAGLKGARIQRYGQPSNNEVLIALEQRETSEAALDEGMYRSVPSLQSTSISLRTVVR